MKTNKLIFPFFLISILGLILMRCTEDSQPTYLDTYSITGTVSYPDGTADGAVVYLKVNATEATTSYDLTATAASDGTFSFVNLKPGNYSLYANYNSANDNNSMARYEGMIFAGEPALVEILNSNLTQTISLTTPVSSSVNVNTTDTGDWTFDDHHSEVVFEFPFDAENSTFSGRFDIYDIEIVIDDANMASSSILAKVDLLTVKTGQPGRDGLWTYHSSVDDVDSTDLSGARVNWFDAGCLTGYLGAAIGTHFNTVLVPEKQFSTWESTSIEQYADGYRAQGKFSLNTGVDIAATLYFKFIPGFVKGDAPDQTQMSSFEGKFSFAAKTDFGISSSHLGDDVDVFISALVSKPL